MKKILLGASILAAVLIAWLFLHGFNLHALINLVHGG
jgi:hypothetical protein